MTFLKAKQLLSGPLRFGDLEQIEAAKYLSLFEEVKALKIETVCQCCKGAGHVICNKCGGSGVRALEHCDREQLEQLLDHDTEEPAKAKGAMA